MLQERRKGKKERTVDNIYPELLYKKRKKI